MNVTETENRPAARPAKGQITVHERKRRRKRLWSWLAPVLGVALIGVIFVTTMFVVPLLTAGVPAPEPDEVSEQNTTQFGDAGVAWAARYGRISLNMSELPLTAADVGMESDDAVTVTAQGLLDLTMYTGQGDTGYWKGVIEYFTIETTDGDVSMMEFAEARTGWAEFNAIMARATYGAELYGWGFDEALQEEITDAVGDAVRNGDAITVEIPPGDDFGMSVRGEVRCQTDGFCQLVTILEPTA